MIHNFIYTNYKTNTFLLVNLLFNLTQYRVTTTIYIVESYIIYEREAVLTYPEWKFAVDNVNLKR